MISKPTTPHQNCRESREVPFFPRSDIWEGVRDKIICSVDVDGNMQFDPRELALSPETRFFPPARPLPHQRLVPVPVGPNPRVAVAPLRQPLKGSDTNILVLCSDISRLESENKALRKQMAAQEVLIRGFCKMYVANGSSDSNEN
jgi:hypothetical protein